MRSSDQISFATRVQRPARLACDSKEILRRLADNPRDAKALVAVYENHAWKLMQAATRWFGNDRQARAKAINSILAAIARQAAAYDSHSTDASEWIHQFAEDEARKLRVKVDKTRRPVRRAGRTL